MHRYALGQFIFLLIAGAAVLALIFSQKPSNGGVGPVQREDSEKSNEDGVRRFIRVFFYIIAVLAILIGIAYAGCVSIVRL